MWLTTFSQTPMRLNLIKCGDNCRDNTKNVSVIASNIYFNRLLEHQQSLFHCRLNLVWLSTERDLKIKAVPFRSFHSASFLSSVQICKWDYGMSSRKTPDAGNMWQIVDFLLPKTKNLILCYCAAQTLIIPCSKWQGNLQKWYMSPLIMHISAKWNIKPWGCSSPGKAFRRAHKNTAFKHLPVKSIPLFSVSHLLSHPDTHPYTHTLRTLLCNALRDTNQNLLLLLNPLLHSFLQHRNTFS